MSAHHAHLDFSQEDWDVPVQFFDKCWVIASRHHPGLNQAMLFNNRVFVFALADRQKRNVLVVLGCGGSSTIQGVRAVAKQTGLPVAFVVGNGGGHHLFLDLWYEAFPEARVLVPAKRIPFTRNGQALQKKWAARWELMHGPRPSQLVDEFGDQIDVVIFDQLFHYKDQTAAELMQSPADHTAPPTNVGGFSLMMAFGKMAKHMDQPNDEVTFFHRASGLAIAGHNYQFMYRPKGYKPPEKFKLNLGGFLMGLMMNAMMPKGGFVSTLEGQPGPIADPKVHAQEWGMVLDWDVRAWTTAHDPPTVCGPDLPASEIKNAIRASIARSGEDDPTGARLKWNLKHGRPTHAQEPSASRR